jgi:hypothetical protein
MTGSSIICGLIPCHDPRSVFSTEKPKTLTFDADIFVHTGEDDEMKICKALLHYFVITDRSNVPNDALVFVVGKMSMVDEETPVGDGYNWEDYVLQIEAITVRLGVLMFMVL